MPVDDATAGRYLRTFVAVLSVACGLVHFAASNDHFDVSLIHGWGFAVTGWLQIVWAIAIIVRPDRRVLIAGAALNLAIIGVWAISRTAGLPFGHDAWAAEPVEFADGLVTAFEAVIVLTMTAVLRRLSLATQPVNASTGRGVLASGSLAVAVSPPWRSRRRSHPTITPATVTAPTATTMEAPA